MAFNIREKDEQTATPSTSTSTATQWAQQPSTQQQKKTTVSSSTPEAVATGSFNIRKRDTGAATPSASASSTGSAGVFDITPKATTAPKTTTVQTNSATAPAVVDNWQRLTPSQLEWQKADGEAKHAAHVAAQQNSGKGAAIERYNAAKEAYDAIRYNPTQMYGLTDKQRSAQYHQNERTRQEYEASRAALSAIGVDPDNINGDPSFWERIKNIFTGGGKTYAASNLNNMEIAYAAGQGARDEMNSFLAEDARHTLERAQRDYEEMLREGASERDLRSVRNIIDDAQRKLDAYTSAGVIQRGATEETAKIVDSINASGAADIAKATEGMGASGKTLVNAGVAGVQMGADVGIGALTGGGSMLPMVVRSFGGGAMEARQKGYSVKQQLALGLTNAATEYLSEKMFGGNPAYDTDVGLINRAINAAVDKLGGAEVAARVMSVLSSTAAETLNEGWEEVVSDLLNPMWEYLITGNGDERTKSEKLQEYAEDWLVGVLLGGMGQAGQGVANAVRGSSGEARPLRGPSDFSAGETTGSVASQHSAGDTATGSTPEGNFDTSANGSAEARKTASGEAGAAGLVQQVRNVIPVMSNAPTVASVNGTEIPKTGTVVERLTTFANSIGNKISRPGFGDVLFSKKRIKDAFIGHGIGNAKIDAFAAVPAVIQYGQEIGHEHNWKGRGYDSYVFTAPIEYKGSRDYLGVIVTKDASDSRYYVHEVVDADGNLIFEEKENAGDTSDERATLPGAFGIVASPAVSDVTIPQPSNVVNPANVSDLDTGPRKFYGAETANPQALADLGEVTARKLPGPAPVGISADVALLQQNAEAVAGSQQSASDSIPAKAQSYLQRAERALLNRAGNALGVSKFADRSYLQGIVQAMSEEYLRDGRISQETVNNLFEQAYEQGIVTDTEFYDQYKDLKDILRTTAVSISAEDAADIPDFNDFRQSAFGTLRIANNGTPADIVYEELRALAPELFPAGITHPAEQLQRMYEVGRSIQKVETDLNGYYGEQAEDFKQWARHDFEAAINESVAELNRIKRYADERARKAQEPAITEASVKSAFESVRRARKTADKAKARNLMTDYDNAQVGRLLKGEITLADLDAGKANVKGIREVYEAQREYDRLAETIREYNKQRKASLLNEADGFLSTANDWKDKIAGILYSRETMERNVRDIVPDRAVADQIVDKYFTPVHESEAASTRFKNEYRDRVRDLDLSRDVAKGNTVSEAHAVQLLGEAEDNIRVLNESRKSGEQRDGKTAEEWQAVVRELWEQNPKLDRSKIEHAVQEFRGIYDELFEQMNEVRVRNGYEPVAYRQGYFPHFQPGDTEGVMAMFGKALGIDTAVSSLPTSINGLTHTFKPGITWFGNAQERLGFDTAYDAVEGFDRYIEGVSDVIHQTDNIQRLRALASQIRYRTTDEGMQKQMEAIRENPNLTEEEKRDKLDTLYQDGRFTLGNFVVELEEYTNLLANKKSRADRNMEQALGRRMYNLVKGLESRVAANMVAVNPGSWLTNFIPLTQGWATLDTKTLLKGMGQTLKAYKTDDGMVARSSFLTNRRGSDPIVKTWAQDMAAKLSSPMEYIDSFTADSLVRARYMQNVQQGLSEDAAIKEADAWAAGIMADRSKGSTPTLFNRTNPFTKLFTQFQLEVNNEFSNLFKDVPDELKEKGLGALAAGLFKYFVGAFLYNEVYEYVVGRRAAFDPIGILNDTVGDLSGYELPNLIEGAQGLANGEGADVFRTNKVGTYNAVANLAGNAAEELPFVGGLLGGGRLPISSALPDLENISKAAFNDQWSDRKRLSTAAKELGAPLTYMALPFGGGHLKKIYQGLSAVAKGGSYSVDAQGRDIMQYPVFNDTPGEIAGGVAKSLLFGKSSLPAAREWVESGFDSFSAKETAVYRGMNDAGVSDRDAYALLQELGGVRKTDDESANDIKRRILREADISGDGKSVVYYGLLASDKERELMDGLANNSDMGAVTEMLMQFKDNGGLIGTDATRAKYQTILDSGLTELGKRIVYRAMVSDENEDTLNKLSVQGVGIDDWLRYQAGTAGLTADKDANGKTISGSKKAKELAVIDALPLTDKQKDALYLATNHTQSTINDTPWRSGGPRYLPGPESLTGIEVPVRPLPVKPLALPMS